MRGSFAASVISGTISNPYREANRMHRRTRSGSSKKVSRGGNGVLTTPFFKSSSPCSNHEIVINDSRITTSCLFSKVLDCACVDVVEEGINGDIASERIL